MNQAKRSPLSFKTIIAVILSFCVVLSLCVLNLVKAEEDTYTVTITNGLFDPMLDEEEFVVQVSKGETKSIKCTVYGDNSYTEGGKYVAGIFTEPDGKGDNLCKSITHYRETEEYFICSFDYCPTEDKTLYVYYVDPITLTLDGNGGSYFGMTQVTDIRVPNIKWINTEAIGHSHHEPTRDGYTFKGYSTDKNATTATSLDDYVASSSETLYAIWERSDYFVRINNAMFSENDTTRISVHKVPVGSTASISEMAYDYYLQFPEKMCAGVYTEENGKGTLLTDTITYYEFNGVFYYDLTVTPTEDMDLYVYWADPAEVTFDTNGGAFADGTLMKMQIRPPGVKFKVESDDPYNLKAIRSEYSFEGWSTDKNASSGTPLSDLIVTGDTTYYAIWKSTKPHEHTEVTIKGKPATCTEDGLTDGIKCSECGEVIVGQETIKAKGHEIEYFDAEEPSCTEVGHTKGSHCRVCGEVFEAITEIPAKGHTEQTVKGKPATCTESGLTDGIKCSVCGEWIKPQEEIVTTGHKGLETVVGYAATCTEAGLTDGLRCSACNEWVTKQKPIPAKGHTIAIVKGYAATCTEPGLTEGEKCSVCGEILKAQETVPALGHDFKDGKCTRCGAADPSVKPDDPSPVDPTPVVKQNGLADSADKDGNWWFYKDGKIDTTHNGVDQNKYGWWRVENGKVNFNAQSIYQNQLGWWKTTNGKVTFKEEGVFQNGFGWWRVKDSKVDFNAQSIYQNKFGWWKTTNGKVTFKENGLFKNQYGTWKVENSKVNFNFNGQYQGKTIKNGKVV